MNKKFAVGLSSLALAGTFLACGDGEIFVKSEGDDAIQFAYVDAQDSSMMKNAIKDCQNDPVCKEKMGNYNPDVPSNPTTSSASQQQPGPINPSSSSTVLLPPSLASSSSLTIPDLGTSSSGGDIPTPPQGGTTGDLGSCAPVTTPIEKGGSTSWKFTFNKNNTSGVTPMDILNFDADWNFGNAGTPSVVSVTGLASPGNVTYMNSGTATASVTLSNGLKTETIQCSPLQVNGAPITGCKCTAAAATADVAAGGVATWTVTGCTSVGQTITGYEWTKATGVGESASYSFTEKGQTLAPTVKVSNDDNTVVDVTCDEVKAVDSSSPDYLLEVAGDQVPQDKINVANEGCITVSGTWSNEYYHPTLTVTCDAKGSNVNLEITYGTESAKGTGDYGVNNIAVTLGTLNAGAVSYQNVCISLSGAEFAACGLGTK